MRSQSRIAGALAAKCSYEVRVARERPGKSRCFVDISTLHRNPKAHESSNATHRPSTTAIYQSPCKVRSEAHQMIANPSPSHFRRHAVTTTQQDAKTPLHINAKPKSDPHEWNKSHALSHNRKNSSLLSAPLIPLLQSSSLLSSPSATLAAAKAALFASDRLKLDGGLPLSLSYSSRPRLRPFIDDVRARISGRGPSSLRWGGGGGAPAPDCRCAPGIGEGGVGGCAPP
jgi:hypothetical protein